MLTRRTLATSSLAGLLAVHSELRSFAAAQTPEAATPVPTLESWELEYQGTLGFRNLPDLPSPPDGECAVVMQAVSSDRESVAVVYHNASDEVLSINSVTATYTPPEGSKNVRFEPENTTFGPHTLQPGEYGISCPAFRWYLKEDGDVVVDLDVVPESEADPANHNLSILRIDAQPEDAHQSASVSAQVVNSSPHTLAEGHGIAGIFFNEEGEILDWFNRSSRFELEARGERYISFTRSDLQVSDSMMVVYGGRIVE